MLSETSPRSERLPSAEQLSISAVKSNHNPLAIISRRSQQMTIERSMSLPKQCIQSSTNYGASDDQHSSNWNVILPLYIMVIHACHVLEPRLEMNAVFFLALLKQYRERTKWGFEPWTRHAGAMQFFIFFFYFTLEVTARYRHFIKIELY